jgi:DNA-binding SARP family transcriptional activator/DNA replicative helicase MCM subunit Mcm2 (Cdc46/Mcm family)
MLYRLAEELRPVPRDQLAFLFWPDVSDKKARQNLTRLLSFIRNALPHPELFLAGRDVVGLDPYRTWSDSRRFSQLSASENPSELEEAVALYQGPFLSGFSLANSPEFDDWLFQAQRVYERVYLEVLARLVEAKSAAGDGQAAVHYAQKYLAVDELDEEMQRQLISLYAKGGDRAAAQRQYERCVLVLERELGVEPLPETRQVYEAAFRDRPDAGRAPAVRPAWTTLPSLELPLIGREGSWRQLESAYQKLQSGGVIFLVGEPGIGKSRLLQEFATSQDRLVLTGNSHASTQELPYQPIVQALRQALPRPALWSSIRPIWLAEAIHILPEMDEFFPGLPETFKVEPAQAQARLFEAISQIFAGLAEKQPLLLCLDDVHWADEATLGWLNYLANQLAGSRLCILATYQSQEAAVVADLRKALRRGGLQAQVDLSGLSPGDIADVLGRLPDPISDPHSLIPRLHEATAGNPFFVLETIRTLLEKGQLASPPAELPLPQTVQEAIHGRLERLGSIARQVLEAAAVLSPELAFEMLQRTAGRAEQEVMEGLEALFGRQLLIEEDASLRFQHDLVRVVTYEELSYWRRCMLHRRTAEALLDVHRKDLAPVEGQLARNFDAAGESGRAFEHYVKAAAVARGQYAHEEAVLFLQGAINLIDEIPVSPTEVAGLHESLAENLAISGQYAEASEEYRNAFNLAPAAEVLWRVELQRKLGMTLIPQHRWEEVTAAFDAAIDLTGQQSSSIGEKRDRAWLRVQMSRLDLLYYQQKSEEIDDLVKLLEPYLDEMGIPEQRAEFYWGQIQVALLRERFRLSEETVDLSRRVMHLAEKEEDREKIYWYQFGLGFSLLWHGNLAEAEEQLTKVIAAVEKFGHVYTQNVALTYLTVLHRLLGDIDWVRIQVGGGLKLAQRVGNPNYIAAAWSNLAWLDYRDGSPESAKQKAQKAAEIWNEGKDYPFLWLAHWILLAVSLDQGQVDQAVSAAQVMLGPKQQRLPDDVTEVLKGAKRSWQNEEAGETRATLEDSVKLAKGYGYL